MKFERQERGLVRPIFEQGPPPLRSPGGAIHEAPVVDAQPRKCRQVMRANQDVDAVDLVKRKAVDRAAEMAVVYTLRSSNSETLRRERNPSGRLQAEFLDGALLPADFGFGP